MRDRMTAKRFTIQGVGISDHERKRLYDLKTVDGFISIRDLLNGLHEENEQLKKQLMDCEKFRHTVFQEISKEMNKHD